MTLITCDCDCVYQQEGYCRLETPSVITNSTDKGCAHYIEVGKKEANTQAKLEQKKRL